MGVTKCAPGTTTNGKEREGTGVTMDAQLLQFLDFIYNEVLVDVDVLEQIDEYIKMFYGDKAPPGGFMDVYRKWFKGDVIA
jgi:hypothetical protein